MRVHCFSCETWNEVGTLSEGRKPCKTCGKEFTVESCYRLATLGSYTLGAVQNAARDYAGCDTCSHRFECFTS